MKFAHLSDEQLQLYLDDPVKDKSQIEQHLQLCENCRNALQQYQAVYSQLRNEKIPHIMSDQSVEEMLKTASKIPGKKSTLPETLLIIASLVVSVSVSFYFFNPAPLFGKLFNSLFAYITEFAGNWSPHLTRTLPILLVAVIILILFDLADRKFIRPKLHSSVLKSK